MRLYTILKYQLKFNKVLIGHFIILSVKFMFLSFKQLFYILIYIPYFYRKVFKSSLILVLMEILT